MKFEFHGLTQEMPTHWLTSHTEVLEYLLTEHPEAEFYFDDGLHSQYKYAAPILEKHDIVGNFGIIGSHPGIEGYMSWAQIRDLAQRGHNILNHTYTHTNLIDCTYQRIQEEISKTAYAFGIADVVPAQVTTIIPPYNSYNDRVVKYLKEIDCKLITGRKTVCSSVKP